MTISKKRTALAMTSLLVAAGATAFQAATGPIRVSAASPPHIMVIVDENAAHDATLGSPYIDGNPAAPYINNTLRPTYTEATNWFGVEHVSSFDYYDLISGADQKGMTKPYPGTTFVDQLAAKKISWKAYIESMPSTCYTGGGNGMYDPGHNPFIAFKSIVKNPAQCNNDVPATNMVSDLNSATPPSFVWVSPNQCDDMHSKCAPTNNFVAQGDSWLKTTVPAVQSTQWYKNGGIIIVTWDESVTSDTTGVPGSTDSGGHIATLVISAAPPSQYTAAGDHFGTLLGLQNRDSDRPDDDQADQWGHRQLPDLSNHDGHDVAGRVVHLLGSAPGKLQPVLLGDGVRVAEQRPGLGHQGVHDHAERGAGTADRQHHRDSDRRQHCDADRRSHSHMFGVYADDRHHRRRWQVHVVERACRE
jgi:phosphatidylinositol-3-phosphatase